MTHHRNLLRFGAWGLLGLFAVLPSHPPASAQSGPDADYDGIFDNADLFPCDWRRTGVSFVPAETEYATLLFEDNWPSRGDLDFNDAVLLYNYAVYHDAAGAVTGVRMVLVPRA